CSIPLQLLYPAPIAVSRSNCSIPAPIAVARPSSFFAPMKLAHDVHVVHTKHPFVIARGGASEWRLVRVRLGDSDGGEGWGEAAPNRFYGETTESAIAAFGQLGPVARQVLASDPFALEDLEAEM